MIQGQSSKDDYPLICAIFQKNLWETYFTQIYRGKTRRFSSLHFQFLFEPKETSIVQFDKLSTVDWGPSKILLHLLTMLHYQVYILK